VNPSTSPGEKRREARQAAKGSVTIQSTGLRAINIEGELMDISVSGFRMAHQEHSLEPGQTVEFSHAGTKGTARVVWNRIVEQRVESGFFILARR
jgi:hypothetical protein